jgi:hypothetical protein
MDVVPKVIQLAEVMGVVGCIRFMFRKGRYPWYTVALFVVPGINLLWMLYFETNEWRIERRLRRLENLENLETGDGSNLLAEAARLDRKGEWSRAISAYEHVLREPRFQQHHEYARNCLKEIQRKLSY